MDTKSNNFKKMRGVMNLLIRKECIKALDCLSDDDKMDELAQKFSMDDDYTSHVNYEIARKWCYDQLKQCIEEHFSNPPLKFEELKEGMWVWDNKTVLYIRIAKIIGKTIYVEDFLCGFDCYGRYEENRFYRKEV